MAEGRPNGRPVRPAHGLRNDGAVPGARGVSRGKRAVEVMLALLPADVVNAVTTLLGHVFGLTFQDLPEFELPGRSASSMRPVLR
jgi:hypothetical protein